MEQGELAVSSKGNSEKNLNYQQAGCRFVLAETTIGGALNNAVLSSVFGVCITRMFNSLPSRLSSP